MFGRIFKSKTRKALDKVFETYDILYKQYREYSESENELYQHQGRIIRGQLFEVGAAFDLAVSVEAPSYLDEVIKEYGFIPYTATAMTTMETHQVWDTNPELARMQKLVAKVNATNDLTTRISRLMNLKYTKEAVEESAKHLELIEEARSLKMLADDRFSTNWHCPKMMNILNEVALLPKNKFIASPEAVKTFGRTGTAGPM